MKSNLICSAGSREDLQKMINQWYYSSNCVILDDLSVFNKKLSRVLPGVRVRVLRGRWRFELVDD